MSSSSGTSDLLITPPRMTVALQTMNWKKSVGTFKGPSNLGISKWVYVHLHCWNRHWWISLTAAKYVNLSTLIFTDYTLVLIIHCRLSLMRGCDWLLNHTRSIDVQWPQSNPKPISESTPEPISILTSNHHANSKVLCACQVQTSDLNSEMDSELFRTCHHCSIVFLVWLRLLYLPIVLVKAITTSLHSRSVLGRVIVESLTKSFN